MGSLYRSEHELFFTTRDGTLTRTTFSSGAHCHGSGVRTSHPVGVGCLHGSALLLPAPLPACGDPDAIWLYLRFTLSYRDVEDLLAERGLEVSYETVRRCGF